MVTVGSSFEAVFPHVDDIGYLHEAMVSLSRDENDALYKELWHACAGPNVKLPSPGDKVIYFPQGHLEQIEAFMNEETTGDIPTYDLPAEIPCTVVYVQRKVESETEELYAKVTILPEPKQKEADTQMRAVSVMSEKTRIKSFSKVVTASDTSTHGGFSVFKRHAEDCFPPLNKAEEAPTQVLVAKDFHNVEWQFCHVYRGAPKRHLLSTGWGTFVSAKRMVEGDTFVVVRGDNGELRVGIRRRKRPYSSVGMSIVSTDSMKLGIIASAAHAISQRSILSVFYRPRICPSKFVVPCDEYNNSMRNNPSVGMKFRWKVYEEKCLDDSLLGTIIAIEPQDPIKWPNSTWKCLKAKWNVSSAAIARPDRLSPWEIEPVELFNTFPPIPKRARTSRTLSTPSVLNGDKALASNGLLQGPEGNPVVGSSATQPTGTSTFKLFGVNLPIEEPPHGPQLLSQSSTTELNQISGPHISTHSSSSNGSTKTAETRTPVQKFGVPLERSIDLMKLNSYIQLVTELDMIFDCKGALMDENSDWLVAYVDEEGDLMLIGDNPWREFRALARKILICPKKEVFKNSGNRNG